MSGSNERSLRAHALTFDTGFSGSLKQYRFSAVPTSMDVETAVDDFRQFGSEAVVVHRPSPASRRVGLLAVCRRHCGRPRMTASTTQLTTPSAWGAGMSASWRALEIRAEHFSRSCSWSALAAIASKSESTPHESSSIEKSAGVRIGALPPRVDRPRPTCESSRGCPVRRRPSIYCLPAGSIALGQTASKLPLPAAGEPGRPRSCPRTTAGSFRRHTHPRTFITGSAKLSRFWKRRCKSSRLRSSRAVSPLKSMSVGPTRWIWRYASVVLSRTERSSTIDRAGPWPTRRDSG